MDFLNQKPAMRLLNFFVVVENSVRMKRTKVLKVSEEALLKFFKNCLRYEPYGVEFQVSILLYSDKPTWRIKDPLPFSKVQELNFDTGGRNSNFGSAFDILNQHITEISVRGKLPPIIILLNRGDTSDEFLKACESLNESNWGKISQRILITFEAVIEEKLKEAFLMKSPYFLGNPQDSSTLEKFLVNWVRDLVESRSMVRHTQDTD